MKQQSLQFDFFCFFEETMDLETPSEVIKNVLQTWNYDSCDTPYFLLKFRNISHVRYISVDGGDYSFYNTTPNHHIFRHLIGSFIHGVTSIGFSAFFPTCVKLQFLIPHCTFNGLMPCSHSASSHGLDLLIWELLYSSYRYDCNWAEWNVSPECTWYQSLCSVVSVFVISVLI